MTIEQRKLYYTPKVELSGASGGNSSNKTAEVQNLFDDNKTVESNKPGLIDSMFGAREIKPDAKGVAYNGGTKTAKELVNYSVELYNAMYGFGTDTEAVNKIIYNSGLNSYDMLGLLVTYSYVTKDYLTNDISKKFSGQTEKNLMQTLANSLMDVMKTEGDKKKNGQHYDHRSLERASDQAIRFDTKLVPYITSNIDTSSPNISPSTIILGTRG